MVIRPNDLPQLKTRTIRYTPRVDLTRVKTEVVAIEFGCRSDGIACVAPGLQGQDLKSGQFDITPFSADYVYHSGRLIRMKPGAGSLGEWANTLYPLYPLGSVVTLDLIRPSFYLYVLDNDYFVPDRNEYKIEISPLVIITRKQHP